jgi:predicted N-acetyltransferase YhbS
MSICGKKGKGMITIHKERPAHRFGIRCEFKVPEEAFMDMPVHDGAVSDLGEIVRYLPEFRDV